MGGATEETESLSKKQGEGRTGGEEEMQECGEEQETVIIMLGYVT